jgi:hypothetical protein
MSAIVDLLTAAVRSRVVEASELVSLEDLTRAYILAVLESFGGNKTRAARILGIDRRSLYRWLARIEAGKPQGGIDARQVGLRAPESSESTGIPEARVVKPFGCSSDCRAPGCSGGCSQ